MSDNKNDKSASAKVGRRKSTLTQLRENKFVDSIREGNNGSQAVIDAGYKVKDRKVASVVASELLNRPSVLALLNMHEQEAERVIVNVMNGKHSMDRDKIAAAKLLLAYTRGNPVSRNENINVSVSLEDILAS